MHFSWSPHLELARTIEAAGDEDCGAALAVLGVGMVVILHDLEHDMHKTLMAKR